MDRMLTRRLAAIGAVAWTGTLGVLAVVLFGMQHRELVGPAFGVGFVFACVFLMLSLLSGVRTNLAMLVTAGFGGMIGFWFDPLALAVDRFIGWGVTSWGWEANSIERFSMPLTILVASVLTAALLKASTRSGSVAFQTVLAGLIASGCTLVPGNPGYVVGAAVVLWNLIVYLSLGSWARDHAMRLSCARRPVPKLGQEGPLATLARGSK